MIQPIDTAAFKGPPQSMEDLSAALKPFSQVLKEKTKNQESPEKEKDAPPSKEAKATGLQEFLVYWFGQKETAMAEPGVPEDQKLAVMEDFTGWSGSATGGAEHLILTQPECGPSPDQEALSFGMEPRILSIPLENAGGSKVGQSLTPATTPLLNQKEIMAQEKKPVPIASVEAKGLGLKEEVRSFYLLTPQWGADAQFLGARIIPLGQEDDLPALMRGHIPASNFETEKPLIARPTDPFLSIPEKASNGLSGVKSMDSIDPLPAPEPMASPTLTGHGPWPSAIGGAARLARPISSLEVSYLINRIGERMVWSAKNNGEIIRLHLEPPELGSLAIRIEKENNQIKATLLADNLLVKDILETHQSHLQRSLERDGFKLAQYDVFVQKDMESFEQFEGRLVFQEDENQKRVPTPGLESDSAPLQEPQGRTVRGRPGSGNIDRWV